MGKITDLTTGIRAELVIETYKPWLKKKQRVLDVGCGDGILSQILQEKFDIKITGCDIENYLQKNIPFVTMKQPGKLPFPDKSFEVIMFNDVLHHTSHANQEMLLKEACRVANKILIFEEQPSLVGSLIDWGINKLHSLNMPVTLTFRSPTQWMQLFDTLHIKAQYKEVRKPLLYPLVHEAFLLSA